MKWIKEHNDELQLALILIAAFSAICFVVGLCMYGDWVRTLRLYNAGLISDYSVNYHKITCYEPGIKSMYFGTVFGILDILCLAIVRREKNGA